MNLLKFTLLCYVFIAPLSSLNETPPIDAGEPSFQDFLKLFPTTDLPFEIDFLEVSKNFRHDQAEGVLENNLKVKKGKYRRSQMSDAQRLMGEFIKEVQYSSFSRMGPIPHSAVARVDLSDDQHAVIFVRETIFPSYFISIFSKEGKEIETKHLANFNRKVSMTCKVHEDQIIEIKHYKNNWLKNLKEGLADNEIIGYELTKTDLYVLDEEGAFEEVIENTSTHRASVD